MSIVLKRFVRRHILLLRELGYVIRYGPMAPRYAEQIWIRPSDIRYALHGPARYVTCSGSVIDVKSLFSLVNLHDTPRIRSCFSHWVDGVPWEETRDYRIMLKAIKSGKDWAGCRTEDDLRLRYKALDDIFEQTKAAKRLKTRREIDRQAFREEGGILVCIGQNGEPLLYDGFHRFAIALILEVPLIPAQLGFVDREAIGSLEKYRLR